MIISNSNCILSSKIVILEKLTDSDIYNEFIKVSDSLVEGFIQESQGTYYDFDDKTLEFLSNVCINHNVNSLKYYTFFTIHMKCGDLSSLPESIINHMLNDNTILNRIIYNNVYITHVKDDLSLLDKLKLYKYPLFRITKDEYVCK